MNIVENCDQEISELENKILLLKQQKTNLLSMSKTERLAVYLHDTLCRSNHADGCSWYYEISKEIHDWSKSTHAEWLHKANDIMITKIPIEHVTLIINILKKI